MLICPVCGSPFVIDDKRACCKKGHSFDFAKEGYLNLLRTNKSGDKIGDDKRAARCRRDFLNKGYYAPLKDALVHLFAGKHGRLLDICCGEGYYTSAVAANENLQVFGFDISKEMIRLAAKRGGFTAFVANMASIPVEDNSFDFCIHLFAPFNENEFCRVLKPKGKLYTVIPGSHHLLGLKNAVYDTPYLNDEQLPDTRELKLVGTQKICAEIMLESAEDIESVFRMTPYYFHTSPADKQKLTGIETMDTAIEFVIAEYEKEQVLGG